MSVDVDPHRLVDERDLLAVGRPVRRVAESGAERGHLPFARRRRRPAGRSARTRRSCRSSRRASFRRATSAGSARPRRTSGVMFTTGPNSAGAVNTSPRASKSARLPVGDTAADWIKRVDLRRARPQRRFVGNDPHRDLALFPRRHVEEVEPSAGLEHDPVGTERGERDVEVVELGHLPRASRPSRRRPRCCCARWRRGPRGSRSCCRATSAARRWPGSS